MNPILQKFKPHHAVAAVAAIFMLIGFLIYNGGESGIETTYHYDTGQVDTDTYSTYNWTGIIICVVLALGIGGLSELMKRRGISWPDSFEGFVGPRNPAQSFAGAAPGNIAAHTALTVSSHVPPQTLHQALLDTLDPAPIPMSTPAAYLLESRPGLIVIGYGVVSAAPAFTAEVTIMDSPTGSQARLRFPTASAAGPNPVYDGFLFGAQMDGMLAHVEAAMGQRQIGATARVSA